MNIMRLWDFYHYFVAAITWTRASDYFAILIFSIHYLYCWTAGHTDKIPIL